MSRQSKNRKQHERALEFTRLHQQGQKGPKATTPKHGKRLENRAYSRLRRGLKEKIMGAPRITTESSSVVA